MSRCPHYIQTYLKAVIPACHNELAQENWLSNQGGTSTPTLRLSPDLEHLYLSAPHPRTTPQTWLSTHQYFPGLHDPLVSGPDPSDKVAQQPSAELALDCAHLWPSARCFHNGTSPDLQHRRTFPRLGTPPVSRQWSPCQGTLYPCTH